MTQIFNFSSGPAMLPVDVLEQAQQELLNWHNLGTSIMEISHRGKEFIQVAEEAEMDLRDLLNIPSTYKVLFCQGGGRGQFAALPLNLLGNRKKADYINTGYWAACAAQEAKKYCTPNVIDVRETTFDGKRGIKPMNEWQISRDAAYVHYCPNETIDGISIYEIPNFFSTGIIVAADFSSTILSEPLNINQYGIIYASAQKNIGPSGLTLVIIHETLLGKESKICPSILDYTVLSNHNSVFNTPPTFSWYLAGLVFKWLKKKGGVKTIDVINRKKAKILYDLLDSSDFYHNDIVAINRSRMNVPFHLANKNLEMTFLKESSDAGLLFLKGHRTIGGIRASIYNAMSLEGVKELANFMSDFERRYG